MAVFTTRSGEPAAAPTPAPSASDLSPSASPSARAARAVFVAKGAPSKQKVAIMFHGDGDRAITEAAVKTLKQHQVRASIFAIGRWLVEQPTVAGLLTDAGHELGNHTYSHVDFRRAKQAVMRTEVERCRDVLVKQTGGPGVALLAPEINYALPSLLEVAASAGYATVVGFDVDPRDWSDPGKSAISRIVGRGSRAGSIVQLHLGHPETVAALPAMFDALRARGLEPSTVSDLLAG